MSVRPAVSLNAGCAGVAECPKATTRPRDTGLPLSVAGASSNNPRCAVALPPTAQCGLALALRDIFTASRGTDYGRFMRQLLDARRTGVGKAVVPSVSGAPDASSPPLRSPLLPCHLPAVPPWLHHSTRIQSDSRRLRQRLQLNIISWIWTEWLVGWCSFVELGLPCNSAAAVSALGEWHVSEMQYAAFLDLYCTVRRTCRIGRGSPVPPSRGHTFLTSMLNSLETVDDRISELDVDRLVTKAIPVNLERAGMPATAGRIDPQVVLPPDKAKAVRELAQMAVDQPFSPSVGAHGSKRRLRPCDLVPKSQERAFRNRMLETGMGRIISEDDVAKDSEGFPLLYGRFCVPHSALKDRLIFDGRVPNLSEMRLRWMHLPHGSQLARLRLSLIQSVRASGGDLRTWFYQILESALNGPRRALGRIITGDDAREYGLDGARQWRLSLAVLAMGGANSADIAQEVHEWLLKNENAFDVEHTLIYGAPLPSTGLMIGVYLDDFGVIAVVPRSQVHLATGADATAVANIMTAYAKNDVPLAHEKCFGFASAPNAATAAGAPPPAPPPASSPLEGPIDPDVYQILLQALRKYKWQGSRRRVCLDRSAPRDRFGYLVTALKTDKKTSGVIFDLCRRYFYALDFEAVQLNHNVAADVHTDKNSGDSFVLLLGIWTGGVLSLANGTRFYKPGIIYRIPLGMPHSVSPCVGQRYSIIFYSKSTVDSSVPAPAPPVVDLSPARADTTFTIWGTEVRDQPGVAGTPAAKRAAIAQYAAAAAKLPRVTPEFARRVLSLFTHPFMHQRSFMSAAHRFHKWRDSVEPQCLVRWPGDIRDEVIAHALLVVVREADIRRPICPIVSLTDATTVGTGAVHADMGTDLATTLYGQCEHRGERSVLHGGPLPEPECRMLGPLPPMGNLLLQLPWVVSRCQRRPSAHVNVWELTETIEEFIDGCNIASLSESVVNGTDSRVGLGALAHGRSSSPLNSLLRRLLVWSLFSRRDLSQFWLASPDNLGDDPSRMVDLRPLSAPSPKIAQLLTIHNTWMHHRPSQHLVGRLALEVGAASGVFTMSSRAIGLPCFDPIPPARLGVSIFNSPNVHYIMQKLQHQMVSHLVLFVPASTWARAVTNRRRGSRCCSLPLGLLPSPAEELDNTGMHVIVRLCRAAITNGTSVSLMHIRDSWLWHARPILEILVDVCRFQSHVDLCSYRHPQEPPGPQGRFTIVSSVAPTTSLQQLCGPLCHPHRHVAAGGRSPCIQLPRRLGARWAHLLLSAGGGVAPASST